MTRNNKGPNKATEPFYPGASCLPALALAYFFAGAQFIAGLGSALAKRSMPLAGAIGLGAAANVALNLMLIPLWGRDGAAWATLLAYALSTAFLFAAGQRHHRYVHSVQLIDQFQFLFQRQFFRRRRFRRRALVAVSAAKITSVGKIPDDK